MEVNDCVFDEVKSGTSKGGVFYLEAMTGLTMVNNTMSNCDRGSYALMFFETCHQFSMDGFHLSDSKGELFYLKKMKGITLKNIQIYNTTHTAQNGIRMVRCSNFLFDNIHVKDGKSSDATGGIDLQYSHYGEIKNIVIENTVNRERGNIALLYSTNFSMKNVTV